MRMRIPSWKKFGVDLKNEIKEDNVSNGAAALAYYLLLAIFPAAIFLLSLLPYLPIPNLEQAIMDLLGQALPGEAATLFTDVVKNVTSNRSGGLLSFGIIATIWAASSGMYAVMQQLNITYGVKEERPFVKARAVALLLTLMFAFLVIGAFALIVFGGTLQSWAGSVMGWSTALTVFFAIFRWVVILGFLLLALALIYYLGPNVEQRRFSFISPGSLLAMTLMLLASLAFKFYVGRFSDYSATYGSLGAVIILMLWLYITGLVILVGSEVNSLIEHYSPGGKDKGQKRMEEPDKKPARYPGHRPQEAH